MFAEVMYHSEQEILICKTEIRELKYKVYQICGQKYVKLMDCPVEPDFRSEVYACNIPRNIAIEDIFKFFMQCGEIYQVRLLMDFSGYNRGKCFVQYRSVRASREAICCLHEETIEGNNTVVVKMSLNNNQLILKSIPVWISEESMSEILYNFIGDGLKSVTMRPSRWPLKNICFCKFQNHQYAVMAHKKAWPYMNILGVVIDVHWAVPKVIRYATNLYFTNFPMDMTRKEFFDLVAMKVDVKNLVQIRINNNCGCITFVNFNTMIQAEMSVRSLIIRGVQLRFSRMPFGENGQDPLTPEYFDNKTVPVPVYQTPPSMPYLPVGYYPPPMSVPLPDCRLNYINSVSVQQQQQPHYNSHSLYQRNGYDENYGDSQLQYPVITGNEKKTFNYLK